MYKLLSYHLKLSDPGWPGNPRMDLSPDYRIDSGNDCNTYLITLYNHFGTHIDGPRHFNNDGVNLNELPLSAFIYEKPLLLDIPKSFTEFVQPEELQPYIDEMKQADLLLIRSGFSVQRSESPERYAAEGPAVSPAACKLIMDNCPNLKALAVDWISIGSYKFGAEAVSAHQYLQGKYHDHSTCIIEDLNMEGLDNRTLKKVICSPLFIEGIDSAPCTVIAEYI